jgi:protein-S-isoprenylcysteine O-methyltransferase
MVVQWCTYILCLCTFHLLEFFITAIYNPSQATSDSYLINQSITYTTAAITSWMEFWIRFVCLFRNYSLCKYFHIPFWISYLGIGSLVMAQMIRSVAMATAGESFNHSIQTSKKENHVLITKGIYRIFRHPSYVGFFYWSISTQLLLGNVVHTILYTAASWTFFNRRIQYEEESLCKFFPQEYPKYVNQTYMGIPFLKSQKHITAHWNLVSSIAKVE